MRIPIGFWVLFLVLFYGFGLVGSFSLGKLIAVSVAGLWLALGESKKKDSTGPLAYLAVICLSAIFAVDPWLSLVGLQGTYTTGILCALALVPFWACVDSDDRPSLENGLRWAGVAVSIIGLLQLGGLFLPTPLPGNHRVYSTMGSPIYLGALLALCLPFFETGWERGLVIACMFATGSRGCLLAVLVQLAYRFSPKLKRRQILAVLLLAPALAFTAYKVRPNSDKGRLLVWDAAYKACKLKPWLGFGTGNFLIVSEVYHTAEWDKVYGEANTQDQAHNLFLEAASTGGILTLTALSFMLFSFWQSSDEKTRTALVGVFVVGLLNPLPLVVKALTLALVASNIKGQGEYFSTQIKSLSVILLLLVSVLIHWDVMVGVHMNYPWSASSVKAGMLSNALRPKYEFAVNRSITTSSK